MSLHNCDMCFAWWLGIFVSFVRFEWNLMDFLIVQKRAPEMRGDDLNVCSDLMLLVDVIGICIFTGRNVSPLGALVAFDCCI